MTFLFNGAIALLFFFAYGHFELLIDLDADVPLVTEVVLRSLCEAPASIMNPFLKCGRINGWRLLAQSCHAVQLSGSII